MFVACRFFFLDSLFMMMIDARLRAHQSRELTKLRSEMSFTFIFFFSTVAFSYYCIKGV